MLLSPTQLKTKLYKIAPKSLCGYPSKFSTSTPIIVLLTTRRYARKEMITVLVGEKRTPYLLHKDLLMDSSPYFATRLKDCWDGKQVEIEQINVSTRAFEVIIDWMYSGVVPDYATQVSDNLSSFADRLPEMYRAADVLMMTKLQNRLVDANLASSRQKPSSWSFLGVANAHLWEITHTPLYQLILKSRTKRLVDEPRESDEFEDATDHVRPYPEAVMDVLRMTNKYLTEKWSKPCEGDWCEFHIHPDGETCDTQGAPPNKKIKLCD